MKTATAKEQVAPFSHEWSSVIDDAQGGHLIPPMQ